jgi:hypothetical protein
LREILLATNKHSHCLLSIGVLIYFGLPHFDVIKTFRIGEIKDVDDSHNIFEIGLHKFGVVKIANNVP